MYAHLSLSLKANEKLYIIKRLRSKHFLIVSIIFIIEKGDMLTKIKIF